MFVVLHWVNLGANIFSFQVGYDDDGMPIGLQLLGRPWSEATLLMVASAIEVNVKEPGLNIKTYIWECFRKSSWDLWNIFKISKLKHDVKLYLEICIITIFCPCRDSMHRRWSDRMCIMICCEDHISCKRCPDVARILFFLWNNKISGSRWHAFFLWTWNICIESERTEKTRKVLIRDAAEQTQKGHTLRCVNVRFPSML